MRSCTTGRCARIERVLLAEIRPWESPFLVVEGAVGWTRPGGVRLFCQAFGWLRAYDLGVHATDDLAHGIGLGEPDAFGDLPNHLHFIVAHAHVEHSITLSHR